MTAVTATADVGLRDHVVQFYRHEEELAVQAGGYLAGTVGGGGTAVVIAEPAHRSVFQARLAAAGIDVPAARARGAYLDLDAQETMRRVLPGGQPDPAGFDRVIGGLIRRAAASGSPVRVYGEMVALLWDAGLVAVAVELEAIWNDLGRRLPFSLYCAYPAGSVAGDGHADAFAEVCGLHAAVIGQPLAGRPIPGGTVGRTRTFAASLGAPAAARHFVVAALNHQGGGHLADDAALAVTEMAANAIVHARSDFTVSLTPTPDGVRVSVRDNEPLPAGAAGLPAAPLHGLGAVAAMAARWGACPASGGKEVWAELCR